MGGAVRNCELRIAPVHQDPLGTGGKRETQNEKRKGELGNKRGGIAERPHETIHLHEGGRPCQLSDLSVKRSGFVKYDKGFAE